MTVARVDIGMPTRGGSPRWIEEALDSVLAQTFGAWRLVISENGPGSARFTRLLAPYLEDPRISHVTTGRDVGAAGNHNRLIRQGQAPYVALLHDDDRWFPDFLRVRVEALDEHTDAALAFGLEETIDKKGRRLRVNSCSLPPGRHPPEVFVPTYLHEAPIGMTTLIVRRSAYESVGSEFRADMPWMDLEMWFRIAALHPVVFLNRVDSSWRRHAAQTTATTALWGENELRVYDAWEQTLDRSPHLDVDRAPLRERQGRAALQAALDAMETGERARAAEALTLAVEKLPALRRDPRALVLTVGLKLRRVGAPAVRLLRHAAWRVPRPAPTPYPPRVATPSPRLLARLTANRRDRR